MLTFFLSIAVVALLIVNVVLIVKFPKVVLLQDNPPIVDNPRNRVMKLQNEISQYVYREGGKIKIMVVKRK